jgi:hypothetical protein
MSDAARDLAALELELLRVQRGRLADRLRPPWWFLTGLTLLWALVFASPFASRYLPPGFGLWPVFAAALVVAVPLQWAWTRATGIKMRFQNLSSPGPGRLTRYAVVVVSVGATVTEHFVIERGLIVAAIVLAVLAVAAEVGLQQALLRVTRQDLRAGGRPA